MASDRDRLLKAFIGNSKKRRKPALERPYKQSIVNQAGPGYAKKHPYTGGQIGLQELPGVRRGVNFKPSKERGDRDILLRRAEQNYPNAAPFFVPGLSEAARKRSRMKRPRRLGRLPSTRPALNKRPTLN